MLTYRKDLSLLQKLVTCLAGNYVHFSPQDIITLIHYCQGSSFICIYFYHSQRNLKDESTVCEVL